MAIILKYLKNNKQTMPKAILLLAVLLLALTVFKMTAYAISSANVEDKIEKALQDGKESDQAAKDSQALFTKEAAKLKSKNCFSPPPPPKPGPPPCQGVIGDQALFANKLYKVGDQVNGAKLISITPNEVVLKVNGSEKKLYPFAIKAPTGSTAAPSSNPSSASRTRRRSRQRPTGSFTRSRSSSGRPRNRPGRTHTSFRPRESGRPRVIDGSSYDQQMYPGSDAKKSSRGASSKASSPRDRSYGDGQSGPGQRSMPSGGSRRGRGGPRPGGRKEKGIYADQENLGY